MTDRRGSGAVAVWWREAGVLDQLERGLKLLNTTTGTASSEKCSRTARAALEVFVAAARASGVPSAGSPADIEAFQAAERTLAVDCGDGLRGTVIQQALDALLAFPSRNLAIYGSLAPGEVNHHVIEPVRGSWSDGYVRGHVSHVGWGADYGFPALTWDPAGPRVPVKLLVSGSLPDHWDRLDRFEGDGYRRALVPVQRGRDVVAIANIYALRAI